MYIYPEQIAFKKYWASQGDGVGANYYNPTQAIRKQYSNMGKRGGMLPSGRSFVLADLPAQPGDLDTIKYGVSYSGAPRPMASGIPPTPVPETRFVPPVGPEYHYGAGFDKLTEFFKSLWMAIKIGFLKFMAKIGLYRGMIPTHPKDIPATTPDTAAYMGPFSPAPMVGYSAAGFDNHTVIFSREVIP